MMALIFHKNAQSIPTNLKKKLFNSFKIVSKIERIKFNIFIFLKVSFKICLTIKYS